MNIKFTKNGIFNEASVTERIRLQEMFIEKRRRNKSPECKMSSSGFSIGNVPEHQG